MSNGSDNRSGKPPAPGGAPPRPASGVPTITATPLSAPVVQRPAKVPIAAPPPGALPPQARPVSAPPTRPPTAPPPAQRPPGAPPIAPPTARPAGPPAIAPAIAPARPGTGSAPAVAPARPGTGSAPAVAPARPGTGSAPAVAPATVPAPALRPPTAQAAPGYPQSRAPSSPSGVLVPPVARPAGSPSGVLVPPVARPAGSPSGVLVPPVARPAGSPSGVHVPPAPPRPPSGALSPQAAAPQRAAALAPAPGSANLPGRSSPIPESGPIEQLSGQQAAAIKQLADAIDTLDYFEALGLTQQATPGDIKKAFYRESRTYHPDRFFHLPESQTRVDLGTIYKRLTEAYFVLRDDAKRKKYLSDVSGTERQSKLRYTEATEAELKAESRKAVEEEFGNHPKARPLFKMALADIEKENWISAERNLKSGLMFDPGNARFKEALAEVQKKAEAHRKATSSGYMIK